MQTYRDLENIARTYVEELDLAKSNLQKVKRSEALSNLTGYVENFARLVEECDKGDEYYVRELFNENLLHDQDLLEEAVEFLESSLTVLQMQNQFYQEVRERGDMLEETSEYCPQCLAEYLLEYQYKLEEAEYRGRKVTLGKPFLTPDGPKKRSVYVKNAKGNVVKVNFGDPNMKIKKSNPKRRKSFRARHKCSSAKDRTTPRYWSCKFW